MELKALVFAEIPAADLARCSHSHKLFEYNFHRKGYDTAAMEKWQGFLRSLLQFRPGGKFLKTELRPVLQQLDESHSRLSGAPLSAGQCKVHYRNQDQCSIEI